MRQLGVCPIRQQLMNEYVSASFLYVQKLSAFKRALISPDHDIILAEVRRVWQVCADARSAIEQHVNEHHCGEGKTVSIYGVLKEKT